MTTHALLWSRSRNLVRVVPVSEMLSENRIAYTEAKWTDWLPIAIDTRAVIEDAAVAVRGTMRERCISEPTHAHAGPLTARDKPAEDRRAA